MYSYRRVGYSRFCRLIYLYTTTTNLELVNIALITTKVDKNMHAGDLFHYSSPFIILKVVVVEGKARLADNSVVVVLANTTQLPKHDCCIV